MASWVRFSWPNRGTPPPEKLVDDSKWEEVDVINSYAVFMGYMSLAVRGLRFLVITWTTVVLLGGFVSMLNKKDFWSLTVITLVQTTGIFDVALNGKLSNMRNASRGLLVTTAVNMPVGSPWSRNLALDLLVVATSAIQALIFIIILCPLGVLYTFGLPISAGISSWRLIKRDYGNTDQSANLKPALDVLYLLAVVQGTLFCYKASLALAAKALVEEVVGWYTFKDGEDYLVWDYLRETRTGCEKNPSFAKGRNLITYAVDQIDSLSPKNFISGVRILETVIKEKCREHIPSHYGKDISGLGMLINHLLVGSASSAHTLHKLLWALDSRSPYGIETMESAVAIVEYIAGSIRLKQCPEGIECIASLLGTHEELCPAKSPELLDKYKMLQLQILRILWKLSVGSEENCRAIINTQGLTSRIMAPITLDLLNNSYRSLWYEIVNESLLVLGRLVTAAGDTGKKLRQQISRNKELIKEFENFLDCRSNIPFVKHQAMVILSELCMDTSTSMDTESRKKHINTLLHIFTSVYGDTSIRELAGEKLATIASKNRSNAMVILQANDQVLDNLIEILKVGDSSYRISAAEILEQLFIPYIEDNKYLNNVDKLMTEVLREILGCQLTENHTRAEGQDAAVSQMDDGNTTRALKERREKQNARKLLASLLSLSVAILDKLISNQQDWGRLLDAVALGSSQFSLPGKLKEMVQRNSEETTDCLKVLKLISVMVISMMKHINCFILDDLKDLVHTLSCVSEDMEALDNFMVFESGDGGTRIKEPFRTLVSIVKEAQDLVERDYTQGLGTVDHITSGQGAPGMGIPSAMDKGKKVVESDKPEECQVDNSVPSVDPLAQMMAQVLKTWLGNYGETSGGNPQFSFSVEVHKSGQKINGVTVTQIEKHNDVDTEGSGISPLEISKDMLLTQKAEDDGEQGPSVAGRG